MRGATNGLGCPLFFGQKIKHGNPLRQFPTLFAQLKRASKPPPKQNGNPSAFDQNKMLQLQWEKFFQPLFYSTLQHRVYTFPEELFRATPHSSKAILQSGVFSYLSGSKIWNICRLSTPCKVDKLPIPKGADVRHAP